MPTVPISPAEVSTVPSCPAEKPKTLRGAPPAKSPCILVTGGYGYIVNHTLTSILLDDRNYSIVVVDNLVNSSWASLNRVADISNLSKEEALRRIKFYNVNSCDETLLWRVFVVSPKFAACIHFAGLKVRERVPCGPVRYPFAHMLWRT